MDPVPVENDPDDSATTPGMPFTPVFTLSAPPAKVSAVVVFDTLGSPDVLERSNRDVLERGRTFWGPLEASEEGSRSEA